MRRVRLAVAACVLAASTQPGLGADRAPLATVEVTAEPLSETEERAPTSFVTVIDPEPHSEQTETVGDALAETVGVQVRRFGGLGAFSTVSIRGSSANQVQIFLDGVPLSRARNETVNLADLPLDNLARIEVYRGTVPVRFGTTTLGGVVNLVTKPPAAEPATEIAGAYGSFTTRKAVASHTRRLGPIDLLGFVTYLGSEGDFSFVERAGVIGGPADETTHVRRQNNEFDSVDALLKGTYNATGSLQVDLTSDTFFKDQGLAGVGVAQARDAALSSFRSLNYLRATQRGWIDHGVDLTGTLFGEFQRDELDDRKGELLATNQQRRDDTTLIGGNAVTTWTPLPSQLLTGLFQVAHERFAPFNELPQAPVHDQPDQTRLQIAVALEDQVTLFDERLLVAPALRYEHLDDRISSTTPAGELQDHSDRTRDLWSPSLGIQLRPWSWLSLKGNIGLFERAPNFSELFSNTGFIRGRESLTSEKALNRDIGFVASGALPPWIDRIRLEYAYFNNDIDDLIQLIQFSQGVSRPLNIGAARIRGHEVALATTVRRHVGVDVNYTHQDAEDRGDEPNFRGNRLPYRPEDEVYTQLALFGALGRVYYEFNFISGNFLDRKNFDPVPSRDIHTLGASYHATDWLKFTLEARNLTDNQIRDVANFPLPGRAYFGSVKMSF